MRKIYIPLLLAVLTACQEGNITPEVQVVSDEMSFDVLAPGLHTKVTNDLFEMSDVIGLCTEDGKIGGLGNVISFLRSSLGFFLCIVLPLILFFLYELYNFITILVTERSKKVASAAAAIDEEEIKRRAIEEYLAKQKNEEEIKKRAIEEYLAAKKEADNGASRRAEDSSSLASSDAGEFAEAKEDGNTDK